MVDAAFLQKAISAQRNGKFEKAARYFKRILKVDPDEVDALHYYGVMLFQIGKTDQGIRSIERALMLDPQYCDAHNNLGNIFKETGELDRAIKSYRRAVELDPAHASAWNNMGVLLRARGLLEESEQAYVRATAANPAHVPAWQNYGNLLARMDRLDDAVTAYLRVLDLKPHDTLAYDALGRTLYLANRADEAVKVYEEWLRADPQNSVARHMLSSCSGKDTPGRASDAYVRELFDSFSNSFDKVLDGLGYRAPMLIAGLIESVLDIDEKKKVVLDAGCGTGLCAEFLRPRSDRLLGVDLSAGMLDRARKKRQYDQLFEAEIATWLGQRSAIFDLIVSADTLCYFGKLEDVLYAAARALKPDGWFIFTLEKAPPGVDSYSLDFSGRYCHAEKYTLNCLEKAGFINVEIRTDSLRKERGIDVPGFLVSARVPTS